VNADDVLQLVEGAPWWVRILVGLAALAAPAIVTRLWPAPTRRVRSTAETPDEDEDQDVRELRDTLISVLQKLQKAEGQVEALTRSLDSKDDELRRKDDELRQERAQAAALTNDLSQLRGEVNRLQGLLEMVIQTRSTPPAPEH
jgi:septal ring factor EnvC (AmiA/AmiB activator)